MKTLDLLTSTLGKPQTIREITSGSRLIAAVGRWRHPAACVNLSDIDTVQLVFNVSGGQEVELGNCDRSLRRPIRAGTIGVVLPGNPTRVAINGRADIIQIIVTKQVLEATRRPDAVSKVNLHLCESHLQAAGAQALVALANGRRNTRTELERIVRYVIPWLAALANRRSFSFVQGGLSPTAQRKVRALMGDRLQLNGCSPLNLAELAYAAGLSVHHFVKAFHHTEGETPYASVIARRLDLALSLLLQPRARVDWIAEQTGFSSPSHFVSSFRAHMGITPGAVRDAASA
ncbi:MAG: helix-turn-helix transcriptional regulator [Verrucomicrobia bacterium]|nr:helix-turn-helix transcriptional regulator [Verrucomicrobiota bacterium]